MFKPGTDDIRDAVLIKIIEGFIKRVLKLLSMIPKPCVISESFSATRLVILIRP